MALAGLLVYDSYRGIRNKEVVMFIPHGTPKLQLVELSEPRVLPCDTELSRVSEQSRWRNGAQTS
jgi:hypothetical protein